MSDEHYVIDMPSDGSFLDVRELTYQLEDGSIVPCFTPDEEERIRTLFEEHPPIPESPDF